MKGKLVKIYGQRDPALEARRMEVIRTIPPSCWDRMDVPAFFPVDDLYECTIIPPKPTRIIRNFSGPAK